MTSPRPATTSRREFLKQGTTGLVAGAVASGLLAPSAVHAAGSGTLRVGLVGCGGRGSGAAVDALSADPEARLVAMADAFSDYLENSLNSLRNTEVKDRIAVDDDHKFVGFDGYKHVVDASDVVLLATPPHFRPEQLSYAIEQGKHVFCEKPVAVDAPGVRSVIASSRIAEEKGLSLVSGLCWRYHKGMRETFDRIHNGEAGEIVAMQCSYNSQGVWEPRITREQVGSDMEHQMRNWYYYGWLSGDFNVEQHIHSLDKMQWAMKDEPPARCSGSGGRIQRTEDKYGNIYDHFDIVYEYANGVKAFARCRHFRGAATDVTDHIMGTRGRVDVMKHRIHDLNGNEIWRFQGDGGNMYRLEHEALFASIRNGEPINNGEYMCRSTLMAIMGRMAAYTGKEITWDKALNSEQRLGPAEYAWGSVEAEPISIPGITPFV